MSKKDAYIQKAQAKIDEQTAKLLGLKAKAKGSIASQKIQAYDQIEKLEKSLEAAKARLTEINQAAEDKWEELTARFDSLSDDLSNSVKNFLNK